ncbi:MAG TPA: ATP-binding protein [candidate division Zixibacteria bacterium]|nr:ATP-binding protein [candidate division Zixibacteria bacterium]
MSLRRRDVAALALAAVVALAGLTAWLNGQVVLGLSLGTDADGYVVVQEVVPGSLAARSDIREGQVVVELGLRDETTGGGQSMAIPAEFGGGRMEVPSEPVPADEITYLSTGERNERTGEINPWVAFLDVHAWRQNLLNAGILLIAGAGFGALMSSIANQGPLAPALRGEGIPLGVGVALPFMTLPLLYTGLPITAWLALGLVAAGELPLARSLADRHPVARWPDALFGASVLVAVTVLLVALQGALSANMRVAGDSTVGLLLFAVPLLPAAAVAFGVPRAPDERFRILVGASAAAAASLVIITDGGPNLLPLAAWLAMALLGPWVWRRLVRTRQALFEARAARSALRVRAQGLQQPEPAAWHIGRVRVRDAAAIAITLSAGFTAVTTTDAVMAVAIGLAAFALAALLLQRGLLGAAWRSAAIPVAATLAIPVFGMGISAGGSEPLALWAGLFAILGALPVAGAISARHPDPGWRRTLFLLWGGMAVAAMAATVALGLVSVERYLLMGFVPVLPGLMVAFSQHPGAPSRLTDRLDVLALSVTPGAAMTMLVHPVGIVLCLGWVVVLVAWRRFTIAPLVGLAARTQRERDLAVAAVEAERARLAADLHDDALQELSALVRRLDAAGDAEGAELARGVAERLRTITSDLRLPLLDDLGAGPALEWLVGRVRPLTDGEVLLERADDRRPPPGVELAVFRVAQEALANAVKHGRAPIRVRYRVEEDGSVSLSVDDAGPGIEPGAAERALQAGHLGMANMQQRAEQIGALLDIRRWPTGGTHVALEWRPQ